MDKQKISVSIDNITIAAVKKYKKNPKNKCRSFSHAMNVLIDKGIESIKK